MKTQFMKFTLAASLAAALAFTFSSCSGGDEGSSKGSCIKAELEVKANTLDDVTVACNATRSEVLSQLQNSIGSCSKYDLAFDIPIKDIINYCGVSEIPIGGGSSSSKGTGVSSSSGGGSSSSKGTGVSSSSGGGSSSSEGSFDIISSSSRETSSSSSVSIIDPGLPKDTTKFRRFEFGDIALESSDNILIYALSVDANPENIDLRKLDSVVVTLGNKKIKSSGELQNYNYNLGNELYTFVGDECCNTDCQLTANAYVLGDRTPNRKSSNTFKRTKGICAPSSSSTASSSSAAVLSFSQIKFSGADTLTLNSKTGNRGVVLSTGSGTANTSEATIYYDGAGFVAGSNVKIITEFRITPTYSGNIFWVASSPEPGYVTTPKNTSDFILRSGDTGRDTEEVSGQGLYYMIRTAPSGDEWNSGDYLVLVTQKKTLGTGDNTFIKILAWKVVES